MAFSIGSTGLQSVNLTTYERVMDLINPASGVAEPNLVAPIEQIISDVSAEVTTYLGTHTLLAERTEVYELRRGKRILTIDSRPITVAPTSIKVAIHESLLSAATAIPATDFTVRLGAGFIRFARRMGTDSVYVELTYTGGLGLTADDVVMNHPDIAYAVALQCAYKWKRTDSIGGNIVTQSGANTQYTGQYRMLGEVINILSAHRRIPV